MGTASAILLRQLMLQHDMPVAKPQDDDRRAAKIEHFATLVQVVLECRSEITLEKLRTMLAGHGVGTSITTPWRLFARHRIIRKKAAHEQAG